MRRLLALVLCCACGDSAEPPAEDPCAAPGTICRVAGTGEAGFSDDGKPLLASDLYLPNVARRAPDGALWVVETSTHRIRRARGDSWLTFVGTGEHSAAQPGVPAYASPLDNPMDLAFVEGGIVFVTYHTPGVFRVDGDGVVEVVAGVFDPLVGFQFGDDGDGGPALEARFQELTSIVAAPDGTLYVADDKSHRVRRIRPDGVIEAVAGTGVAGFSGDGGPATDAALNGPQALALGDDGALYIADSFNHRVRRVRDGVIETVAGTGQGGFGGDGALAVSARVKEPSGLAVDGDTLYIADSGNHVVRAVDAAGVITTVAGTGSPGNSGDEGEARAAMLWGLRGLHVSGRELLIADFRNHCVRTLRLR